MGNPKEKQTVTVDVQQIVGIHNIVAGMHFTGEDIIKAANILVSLRQLIAGAAEQAKPKDLTEAEAEELNDLLDEAEKEDNK